MFVEESLLIKNLLSKINFKQNANVLDIGSSSLDFRTIIQPHINENIFNPLQTKGLNVVHLDQKSEAGVDICLDLTKEIDPSIIKNKFDLILCTNILEHVEDRNLFFKNLLLFAKENTYILFTVPYKYFKHNDPIDTMYRPSPNDLLTWIKEYIKFDTLQTEILTISEKRYYSLIRKPFRYSPFKYRVFLWRYFIKHFRWKVTCVFIRRT